MTSSDDGRPPRGYPGATGAPDDTGYETAPIPIPPVEAESPAAWEPTEYAASAEHVLPQRPPGRHRSAYPQAPAADAVGPRGPSRIGRVVLPLALAVVAAVGLIGGWATFQARDNSVAAPPVSTSTAPAATPSVTPSATSASPTPSPSETVAPVVTPSAAPSTTAPPAVDRTVPVTVLNATSRTGLAASVARQLRALGWTVVSTGNWRSGIDTTTVFAKGNAEAVATMLRDLPAADATKTPIGAMKTNRITIVIGKDYPSG